MRQKPPKYNPFIGFSDGLLVKEACTYIEGWVCTQPNLQINFFFLQLNSIHTAFLHPPVFSVSLVCEKELNLMLKVRETSSQGAMGLSLRGTDFFLPIR